MLPVTSDWLQKLFISSRPMGTFSVTELSDFIEWLCSTRNSIPIISSYKLIYCGHNWGLYKFLLHTNGLNRTENEDYLIEETAGR